MRILAIDTTTMLGSVALADGGRLVAQEQQGVPGTHSERLLGSIDHLLVLAKWRREEINAIAVATGPGSFTGLRIGIATAKGMALALGCPVAGVSSLASLALNGQSFPGTTVAVIDARRGELYAGGWTFSPRGTPKRVLSECVLAPDALIARLKKIRGPLLFVGDGAFAFGAKLIRAIGARARIAPGAQCYPQAMNLALLARARLERGKGEDAAALAPNYIRRSDAEIGFKGKKGKR